MSDYDIVAMGAGHNGLTTCAYLAKAGKKVLLLERNWYAGGGVATQEILTPGYFHDLHSSVHIMIQGNPMITQDELGLIGQFGLKYKYSDTPHVTIFPDQDVLVTYKDLDKTCESISKVSARDAESYRKFVTISKKVLPLFVPGLYKPAPPLGQLMAMLDSNDEGRLMLDYMQRSSMEILNQWFESDRLKIHLSRLVSENLQLPDELGTGMGILLMPGIMHTYGVSQPYGGSGKLTESLVRCVEHHGGEIRLNAEVNKILVSSGRAIGVEMASGEKIMAKDAVIGSMHPHKLRKFIDGIDEPILKRAEKTTLAPFSLFVCHYDLKEKIQFRAKDPAVGQAIMLTLAATDSMQEMQEDFDTLKQGKISQRRLLAGNDESHSDPSRVPPGKGMWHSTGFAPYSLAQGGSARWEEFCEEFGEMQQAGFQKFLVNLTPENIVARKFCSPLDMERDSPNSFVGGDVHGIAPYFYQSAGHRPTPDLGQFKVPGLSSFYLVGPFMHPGGGVFGAGRATAMVMFEDLGMDFNQLVGSSEHGPAAKKLRPLPPADNIMRLYDDQNEEIMAVDSIDTAGDEVVIKGKTFGTMPLVARLGPTDLRRALKLALSPRKVVAIVGMLFRKG